MKYKRNTCIHIVPNYTLVDTKLIKATKVHLISSGHTHIGSKRLAKVREPNFRYYRYFASKKNVVYGQMDDRISPKQHALPTCLKLGA